MTTPYARARRLIDDAHRADPVRDAAGQPAELGYADSMERWILRLDPQAPELLRLAARCQHLERWSVPRNAYPMDKPGYYKWRTGLYTKQAGRAQELLLAAGVDAAEADDVFRWVAKQDLKKDPGSQALEDAACLVFLENEIAGFATTHADYPRQKFIDILRKTWTKMSPAGHALALALPLPEGIAALVREALGSTT